MALVEIARFADCSEAQVAASALRASGIQVFVQNEHWGQAEPYMQLAAGGFRLWTPAADADDAKQFIDERRNVQAAVAPSGNIVQTGAALGLAVLTAPVLGWLALLIRPRRFHGGEDDDI